MTAKPVVIILMGSASDLPHCAEIATALENLGIDYVQRVASAHKSPSRLLHILQEYEASSRPHVYITVAGRSNALSGMVDAMVSSPVIACPPPSQAYAGVDIYSSLRMPSGVAPVLVLEPANAALAAAKMLALSEPALLERILALQENNQKTLEQADAQIQRNNQDTKI
ncbi:MAG: 5-(carboxyamino)imidazole ribonucleotide mutase [Anaerolineales bacterium]|jgi:5-(carboxyamino)imidazole ribonucleotide mutase